MICKYCDQEMERETQITDYHNPSAFHGHGQYESEVWYCPDCDVCEPYILEDEIE